MQKEDKKALCEYIIGAGIFITMIGFIAGIVITAIGGNNWDLMKESPKIMLAFQIDQLQMWAGAIVIISGATAWNIIDKKPE